MAPDVPDGAPGIDPLFGWASGGPNPCMGDAPADCVEEAHPSITVDREVEVRIDLPGLASAAGSQGVLSEETTQSIDEAVRDGTVDRSVLHKPDESVEIQGPDGPTSATVEEIAESLVSGIGFYFEPAGIHLTPGETVLFSVETPDHAVAAFHERHGRQNRVPDGVGPFTSPLTPGRRLLAPAVQATGRLRLLLPPRTRCSGWWGPSSSPASRRTRRPGASRTPVARRRTRTCSRR